jgi:ABC-type glycerol-3-phosphate transport system permease component
MLMAAAVVGMMPILVVYVLAQNWIIKGMSISGGLKG